MTKDTCIKQMELAKTPELREFWKARAIRKGAVIEEPKVKEAKNEKQKRSNRSTHIHRD